MIIIHIGSLMFPFPTIFLEFLAGEFYRKFSETCSRMVISQKDMIAYHEHAVEASNSHLPMLDAVSSEFWEPKIVRKSNGADIYRLERKVKKRDMLGLYKYGSEREKACVFKLRHKNLNRPVEKILETYAQFFIGFVMEKKIRSGYRSCRRITNLKPGEEQEDPERRVSSVPYSVFSSMRRLRGIKIRRPFQRITRWILRKTRLRRSRYIRLSPNRPVCKPKAIAKLISWGRSLTSHSARFLGYPNRIRVGVLQISMEPAPAITTAEKGGRR
ncbi:hypothetical protein Bca52824_047642 [Brassica carinata]|uniref:Uncharacterized protein n=1 Tax=Brassica carinata TaxID=52824 RepID=A0A8X7RF20_BRACI|nr:hypothetical protein Bca52824_047642 [Brassica carinata]